MRVGVHKNEARLTGIDQVVHEGVSTLLEPLPTTYAPHCYSPVTCDYSMLCGVPGYFGKWS